MSGMAGIVGGGPPGDGPNDEDDRDDSLISWLTSLSYDDLVAELLDLADADAGVRALLAARAAARGADELISDGAADEAITLAREAFASVTEAMRSLSVTGASGMSPEALGDAARELLEAHLRACLACDPPPDPIRLGTYLADLILGDALGLTPSLEDYSGLLGRAGTLAIRDRIAAVHQANPGHPNARLLAGSLTGSPATPAPVAALRERRARHQTQRSLDSYRSLRAAARQSKTWDTERAEALGLLPLSVAVDALLDDGDLDAAWRILPEDAAEEQRLRLADASVAARPDDALEVYLAAIEPLTRRSGEAAYQKLVRLLTSARACHLALGTTGEFQRYMAGLRDAHKRKRTLIALLDEAGL